MRFTAPATALAALALVAGAGTATAQDEAPEPGMNPGCVPITLWNGQVRCLNAVPQVGEVPGAETTFGYGSLGTGSLADLLTQGVLLGSNVLSLELPAATGSYGPGSFGSYGPEASVGELSSQSVGVVIQGSLGS